MSTYLAWNKEEVERLLKERHTCLIPIPIKYFHKLLVDAKLCKSISESKRMIKQGAVEVDGIKVSPNLKYWLIKRQPIDISYSLWYNIYYRQDFWWGKGGCGSK